jgi:serine/threonine-protein kinase HipA
LPDGVGEENAETTPDRALSTGSSNSTVLAWRVRRQTTAVERIEYAYSMMVKAAGIAMMMECCLFEENGRALFMTRRFDSREDEKLHMQSLCALHYLDFTRRDAHDYDRYFETVGALGLSETETGSCNRG